MLQIIKRIKIPLKHKTYISIFSEKQKANLIYNFQSNFFCNSNKNSNTSSSQNKGKSESWKPNMPSHKFIIDQNSYRFPHPIWNLKDAEKIEITHSAPKGFKDKIALAIVRNLRRYFDWVSGYRPAKMDENLYIRRCIFLETIAGVPGFIGGMLRHLGSLRSLRQDGGWIHHLLEEAENERMHLFTFLQIKKPGLYMRVSIMISQFLFIIFYASLYLLSPTTAHRFVAYLEEEAVKTYTLLLKEIDEGKLPNWKNTPAPQEAIKYWGLAENATFRDVIVSIRADEVAHREFNHHFADIPKDKPIAGHDFEIIGKEDIEEKQFDVKNGKKEARIEINVAPNKNSKKSNAGKDEENSNNSKEEKNFDGNKEFGKAQEYQDHLNHKDELQKTSKSAFHYKSKQDSEAKKEPNPVENKDAEKDNCRDLNGERTKKFEENEKQGIK